MAKQLTTLITGADKGIGFQTALELGKRGHHVLVGARDVGWGKEAVDRLTKSGITADLLEIDVTDRTTIQAAASQVMTKFGYLDVLINNAGVALDQHQPASELSTEVMQNDFNVNFFGAVDVIQAFLPLLKKADTAKIINVSSNMGSLGLATNPASQFYGINSLGYQASKAALNFATICFAKELADITITVNSVNPGWTATEFGGRDLKQSMPTGMQSVKTGAAQIVKLASDPENKITMTFTENQGTLPW